MPTIPPFKCKPCRTTGVGCTPTRFKHSCAWQRAQGAVAEVLPLQWSTKLMIKFARIVMPRIEATYIANGGDVRAAVQVVLSEYPWAQ